MNSFTPEQLFDLDQTDHGELFESGQPAWTALARLKAYLADTLVSSVNVDIPQQAWVGEKVRIEEGTVVEPGAVILGPAWIGRNCRIRSSCYIRENVVVGHGSVLGNSCEFKNCLLFNHVEAPHFNYVGDSIMGYRSHIGAGVILSNVKLDRREVEVAGPEGRIASGLRKFGALIGDYTEVGCNSVLSPGSILGRHCILYPGSQWRGVLPERRIVKVRQPQEIVERRES